MEVRLQPPNQGKQDKRRLLATAMPTTDVHLDHRAHQEKLALMVSLAMLAQLVAPAYLAIIQRYH